MFALSTEDWVLKLFCGEHTNHSYGCMTNIWGPPKCRRIGHRHNYNSERSNWKRKEKLWRHAQRFAHNFSCPIQDILSLVWFSFNLRRESPPPPPSPALMLLPHLPCLLLLILSSSSTPRILSQWCGALMVCLCVFVLGLKQIDWSRNMELKCRPHKIKRRRERNWLSCIRRELSSY